MQSPNKRAPTKAEREHIARVKALPCGVCDAPPVSDAHEPEQGMWWIAIPLCQACHTGPQGWHGDRTRWKMRKLFTELPVINDTIRKLEEQRA
jgi:hypothetical protein